MEIPQNDNAASEAAKVEAAVKVALDEIREKGHCYLTWSKWPEWCALEVASRFVAKGYHARWIRNMRGNGPSWFWCGVEISKERLSPTSYPKSVSEIIV